MFQIAERKRVERKKKIWTNKTISDSPRKNDVNCYTESISDSSEKSVSNAIPWTNKFQSKIWQNKIQVRIQGYLRVITV